nr:MAG: replication associated protein [Cressdnaviricota sp.]
MLSENTNNAQTTHYVLTIWCDAENDRREPARATARKQGEPHRPFQRGFGRDRGGGLLRRPRDGSRRGERLGNEPGVPRSLWKNLLEEVSRDPRVRYIGGQLERCPSTGRLHIQSYIQLNRSLRGTTLLKIFGLTGSNLRFLSARGTAEECIAYCQKEDSRVEGYVSYGEPVSQGQRTDLNVARQTLEASRSLTEVALKHPTEYIKFHKGFQAWIEATEKQDHSYHKRAVHIKWGPTGIGKTSWANSHSLDAGGYYRAPPFKEDGTPWFPRYRGEKTVSFQDYGHDGGKLRLATLLQVLDNWECTVEYKGGHVYFKPDRILITSNEPPSEWYPGANKDSISALRRRITSCEYTGASTDERYFSCEEWDLSESQREARKEYLSARHLR